MVRSIATLYIEFVGKKALLTVLDYPEYTKKQNGQKAIVYAGIGVRVPIRIVNARLRWGREDVLIRPLRGKGSTWIEVSNKLTVLDDDEDWPDEVRCAEANEL